MKCLTKHVKPLQEARVWIQDTGIEGPPQEIAGLNFETTQICAEAQLLFDSTRHDEQWKVCMLKTIKDAVAVDLQYQSWIDDYTCSKVWGYQVYDLSPTEALPADGRVRVYYDVWTARIWNSCCSKRAHLLEVLLHCLHLLSCHSQSTDQSTMLNRLDLDKDLLTHKAIIKDMVSAICATVPFLLGDINATGKFALKEKRGHLAGYTLMWPLYVARMSAKIGSETEVWIEGRLQFIDSQMGIRFASRLANKIKTKPWNLQ